MISRSDPIGGAQIHVIELARALQDAGHAVMVLAGGSGPMFDRLRELGVPARSIPDMIREIDPIRDLKALLQLRQALDAFDPELVTTHSSKASWLGRALAALARVPVIFVVHGWLFRSGSELSNFEQVARFAEWVTAPLAERLLAVCDYDRAIGIERNIAPPEAFSVVHNGLPDNDPSLRADPGRSPPRIVMVARFDYPKDPVTVIRALAQLRELDWRFELIGDGPDRAKIEAAVRESGVGDRIELLGTRDDVPERLAEAQIFTLVSMREGFPISILEAMRAGLPIAAADVGGIREAVIEGQSGYLVPPADPNALARALEPLIRDASLRQRFGAVGRARFESEFVFETHLRRTWAIYLDVIEHGSAPVPRKLLGHLRTLRPSR